MLYRTAEPMTAPRPRKGESSHVLCGTATAPTRASSPRQLPTDHVHAVPTREYQSDQSSRSRLACHRPCCPKPVLQAHHRECVPAKPPVETVVGARTVLVVKGPLRRAKHRRALDVCAPFRRRGIATGGSGGNTRPLRQKQRPAFLPLLSETPAEIKTPSNPEGLDRSLHIRT